MDRVPIEARCDAKEMFEHVAAPLNRIADFVEHAAHNPRHLESLIVFGQRRRARTSDASMHRVVAKRLTQKNH
jgi:hypothetical protein